MIKFGIIGTNWITKQFIEAAQSIGWQLTSVYSRKSVTAQQFAAQFGTAIDIYTDLSTFFAQGNFTVVYIASPNSLHFSQAKQALLAGKNVIVEKPACSNSAEMKSIIKLLRQHPNRYYFEAARHFHEPLFKTVTQQIKHFTTLQGANLTYMKYSSRYDAFLAGAEPNVFSLDFSGGALQDLGVYLAYNAISWFGYPQQATYYPYKLRNGIDGSGTVILNYPTFNVTLNLGKTANSYLPSEIYGLKEALVLDNPAELTSLTLMDEQQQSHLIAQAAPENPMLAEVRDFNEILTDPANLDNKQKMEDWLAVAVQVNRLLTHLRQTAGIKFPADELAEI
ncbi:MAG: Gfo/Idh/MocA family oxidoreductase [Liquorilactobacillus ghanensis]|uniref:Gfo/Idh/MocA family protein n=1 Tax=Liquorilactobacillus ghanensis TaxID=399370 RepID=UPI0039ECF029